MKCLWLFLNNVCLATTFLQIGNKNAEKEKWKINNKMCFVFTSPPPEVSVWRSDRSGPQIPGLPSHLPSTTQYNTVQDNIATGGRGFDFPTGRFAGVETLVRAGDPGQSEVAGHRAAGVRDGGRHINQHLQRREHTLRSSASIRNLGKKTTWIQIFDGLFFMTSDYLSIEGPEYKIRRGDHIPRHALNSDTSSCRHHNRGDLELTNLSHQYWQRSERVPISPPWVPPPIIFSHSDWLKLTN